MEKYKIKEGELKYFSADGSFSVYVKDGEAIIARETYGGILGMDEDTPYFKHDCDRCIFLGNLNNSDFHATPPRKEYYDLYFCKKGGMSTVIARYGDEGHKYLSGLGFKNEVLKYAEELARNAGVL